MFARLVLLQFQYAVNTNFQNSIFFAGFCLFCEDFSELKTNEPKQANHCRNCKRYVLWCTFSKKHLIHINFQNAFYFVSYSFMQ